MKEISYEQTVHKSARNDSHHWYTSVDIWSHKQRQKHIVLWSSNGGYLKVSPHRKFAPAFFASSPLEVNQVFPPNLYQFVPKSSYSFSLFQETVFPFRSKSKRKSESNAATRGMIFHVVDRLWFMIINVKTDRLQTCKISWGQTCNWKKPSSNPLSL